MNVTHLFVTVAYLDQ